MTRPTPSVVERVESLGWTFQASGHPVEFLSLTGKLGAQVRATVHSFGPLLLGKVLDLNETQTSILALIFKYCDDNDLPLLDLKDLEATLKYLASDEGKPILAEYGGMSSASVGVLLRSMIVLEQEGADIFFGEPEFEVEDLLRTTPEGEGIISILELSDVMDKPRLFSTFMLWMLAQLYESLPEAGDLPKPKLCFFFDEAHLLFDDASEALMDQVERTARLIRSKGVGVYFVTQAPTDVPAPGPRSARQPRPARAARLHARRRRCPAQDGADLPDHRVLRHREDHHLSRHRRGAGHRPVAEGRPDAARRHPAARPGLADGTDRCGPVPGPDRDQPVPDEVRRDRRSRQRLRTDHGADRAQHGRPRRRLPHRPRRRPGCHRRPRPG